MRGDLTFNRSAIMIEAWRRYRAKGRFAKFHGGFARFLRDAWAMAKAVRADMAAGGPQRRACEAAEREARYALDIADPVRRARQDEITGSLCSTDGRLPAYAAARLAELRSSGIGGAHP
ncbi:MAG: hypothetical protein NVS2B5_05820 [Beijerinckiaceae bacterium]